MAIYEPLPIYIGIINAKTDNKIITHTHFRKHNIYINFYRKSNSANTYFAGV